ncbi:hypothetical protein CPLU01_02525 [Colletotrichum plurivorum]|uniref:Uncharacterized protein n=1 Tax=Colletotrichum plurivorum TaxID=2175906 RepID=A0A8H6NMM9_9PEZI|nr:hypothetical protein CPLU01_02525 [Colletotrichum plurivorum]
MDFRSLCMAVVAAMATLASARHVCDNGDCVAWDKCYRPANEYGCVSLPEAARAGHARSPVVTKADPVLQCQ